MKMVVKLIFIISLLQFKCSAFSQIDSNHVVYSSESKALLYFSPVYASGFVDVGFIAFEDLYLIDSKAPNIDSFMLSSSKKSYSQMKDILDTLRMQFKVYNVLDIDSKETDSERIHKYLKDWNIYSRAYLFFFNEGVRKSSSLIGYVIHRYVMGPESRYEVINENCVDHPDWCTARITNL